MTIRKKLFPFLLIVVCSLEAHAQQSQYDKGTPPQFAAGVSSLGSYISTEFGTVNLTNGSLNFNIPLGKIGGRGNVELPLVLSYSSKVWSASMDVDTERESGTEQSVAYADYDNQSSFAGASAPGWTLRAGVYISSTFVRIQRIMSGPSVGCHNYGLHKLILNLPDRGEIEFRDDATNGAPLALNCSTQQTASRGTRWHATDGSGAIFINDVDNGVGLYPTPNLSGTIILADGTRLGSTTNGHIVDRNGNKISGTWDGWMDQLGRTKSIQYSVQDPDNPSVTLAVLITIPGYQGTPRYYKIKTGIMNQNYRSGINPTLPVITGDWDPEGWGYNWWGNHTNLFLKSYGLYAQRIDDREVLTEVVLPDGRALKFRYNEFGEVAEVELPTGGRIQYDYAYRSVLPTGNSPSWETGTNGAGNGIATDVKWVDRAVTAKRTYPDGVNLEATWTFGFGSHAVGSVTYPATVVMVNSNTSALLSKQRHIFLPAGRYTEPYGGQSLHDGTHYTLWSTGVEWRVEVLDAADTVLAASEQDWTQRAPVSWSSYPQEQPANDNRVNQSRRYLENGMMAKTETTYDPYNNPTEVREYDFAQLLKRRTTISYLTWNNGFNYQTNDSIHMLSLPETTTVYNGAGTQIAQTVNEYDVYTSDGNHALLTSYGSVSQHDSTNYGVAKITRGNVTRAGQWLNTTGTFIYSYFRFDVLGNVVSTKDANGNVTTFSFADDFGPGTNPGSPTQNPATPTYALPTLITSPPPLPGAPVHTARSQYDYSSGLLTGFRDRNNTVTQTIYNDPFNRPTQVKAALGVSGVETHTSMYYAPATVFGITLGKNDVLTTSDLNTVDDASIRSWTVTDGFGRTTESWARDPQGDVKVVTLYDGLGRVKQASNPFRPGTESAVYTTSIYDLAGRVTSVTTPDNAAVNTSYVGNTVTMTDQAGKTRKSVTDALGRLIEVYEDPNGLNYLTTYTYDTLDNLVKVTQGTQQRFFMYDSLKRLIRARNPEQGTLASLNMSDPVTGNGAWSIGYQYDANGNLTQKTDARGVVSMYVYDALNRNTTVDYSDTSSINPDVKRFYDGAANGKGRFWHHYTGGDFSTGSNVEHTAIDSYDALGRPLVQRQLFKLNGTWSGTYQTSRGYNPAGGVTSQTYPSGHFVTYNYNSAGRLADKDAQNLAFTGNLGDGVLRTYASGNTYSSWGSLSMERFGTATALYHKLQYNIRGQLWDVRVATGADVNGSWNRGALQMFYESTYTHGASGPDNNGNVLKTNHYVPLDESSSTWAIHDQFYNYDGLNRLTSVAEYFISNSQPLTQQSLQTYTYDRWGNRTINDGQTWGAGINAKQFTVDTTTNRLGVPGGQSGVMTYDNAGNLTTDSYSGAGTRTYDAENRMTTAADNTGQTSRYTYDADGSRTRRQVAGGQEQWQIYGFDGELLAEYSANSPASSPAKEYGYRNGQLLITAAPGSGPNSLSLNGTSNYAQIPSSTSLNISGAITLEAWIKRNASSNYQDIINRESWGQSGTGGGYELSITNVGKARLDLYQTPTTYTTVIGNTTLTTGVWHHIAGVFDGTQMRIYVDGVLDGSVSSSSAPASGTSNVRLGRNSGSGTYFFNGIIDEVRISNAALYNGAFTPQASLSASGSTKGLWKFDGQNMTDGAGNGNTGTLISGTYSNDVPVGPAYYSGSFNGTNAFAEVPNSTSLNISGSLTLEAWIKLNAIGNYQDIINRESWGQAGTGGGYELSVTNVGKARLDLYQTPTTYTTLIGSTTLTTGAWHHIAATFDGSSMRLYVNGVLDASNSSTSAPASGTSNVRLGRNSGSGTYFFNGLIDEVRISNTAIYTGNFTPQQHLTASSNTKGLWKFDSQSANDSSGNGNNATLQGGATYSDDVPGGGGGGGGGTGTGSQIQWLVPDHLGTPRIIVDQTGSLANVKRHDYLPFGEESFAGTGGRTAAMGYAGDGVRQQFTSKERDSETDLDYFLARYYSTMQGRFTSVDPMRLKQHHLANPQDLNRYSYVANNPLAFFDPDGMEKIKVIIRTFIPEKTVTAPGGVTVSGGTQPVPTGRTFQGDDRKVGEPGTFRTQQIITIETDRTKNGGCSSCPFISAEAKAGTTRELFGGGQRNEGHSDVSRVKGAAIYTMAGSDHITVTATGRAADPLVAGAPDVKYDLNIGLGYDKNGDLYVSIDGTHTEFPGIEVLVQRPEAKDKSEQLIKGYNPQDEGRSLFSIYSTDEMKGSKKVKP